MDIAFIEADYYKKNRVWQDNKETTYWAISPFKDGNCGLYAFSCGLIDMIITDKLSLDAKKFNEFKTVILENLIENFKKDPVYVEFLAEDIFNFTKILCKSDLSFSDFKSFLAIQTREGLAAVNLVLAQGLRVIGVKQYSLLTEQKSNCLLPEDESLLENHTWIGEEILSSLANYFGISVKLIYKTNNDIFSTSPSENANPTFSLLNKNEHWHYLLPKNQTDGLAEILPLQPKSLERKNSQHLLLKNNNLLQEIEHKIKFFNKEALNTLAKKLKQIFDHLKNIFSDTPNNMNELRIAARQQANTAVKNSTEILNALRQAWYQHANEFDKHLSSFDFKQIEISLLKEPLVIDHSEDAAVAAILQNAEIAEFLSRNYRTLTSFTTNVSKPNQVSPDYYKFYISRMLPGMPVQGITL